MRKFIHDSWEGIMNMDKNPLRHIPDLQVRHLTLQILAWMWCITFSLLVGSWTVFGYTAVAHFIFILAIIITVATFKAELVDGGSDGYDDGKDFHGEWWKKIPDSKDYGTTGYTVKYSHQICAACESDLVNGKCPICAGDEE